MALKGLVRGAHDNTGLIPPEDQEANDAGALTAEEALKKRRQKLAQDKLNIPPESGTDL